MGMLAPFYRDAVCSDSYPYRRVEAYSKIAWRKTASQHKPSLEPAFMLVFRSELA